MHTLYKKTRTGKVQQWKIWVKNDKSQEFPEVWTEYGLVDGKKQTTFDVIESGVNVGKSNETTPLQQAHLTMERKIVKQKEEGYRDTLDDTQEDQDINMDEQFPKELCFYKPKNSIDSNKIKKLEKSGRLIITVKEDGFMYIIRKTKKFGVEIYSRRMELETNKFPHVAKEAEQLPDGIVLLGEMVLDNNEYHLLSFKKASSICRSDPEKCLERQREFGKTSYKIFDVAFYNNKCMLTSKKYKERIKIAETLVNEIKSDFVGVVKQLDMAHNDAMKYVKENKREGLVLWDSDGIMEKGAAYTFNGKAYRPNVLWKSKPKFEDDFIVRWDVENGIGDYGSGKNKGKIKNVFLYQLDENGKEIYLGKCGGGLTDSNRDYYTDKGKFPRVWRIEYDGVQPGTGALRYPEFNADRTDVGDKDIGECIISDQIKEALGK